MNVVKYYAKSGKDPQNLKTHLLAVGLESVRLCEEILNDKLTSSTDRTLKNDLKKYAAVMGILHDIGKIETRFQEHITSKKDSSDFDNIEDNETPLSKKKSNSFEGPYHNEISALIFEELFREPSVNCLIGAPGNSYNPVSITHALYHHHASNYDFKNTTLRFPTYRDIKDKIEGQGDYRKLLSDARELIFSVVEEFEKITGIDIKDFLKSNKNIRLDENVPSFNCKGSYSSKNENQVNMGDESAKKILLSILITADITISQLNETDALDYIKNYDMTSLSEKSRDWGEKTELSERTLGQLKVAKEMSKYSISISGVDTGGGKTIQSLMATTTDCITIILPKINQVDALDIDDNSRHVFHKKLKVKRIHSKSNDSVEDDDNVRVMVFDKSLSTLFDRRYHELGKGLLNGDLVIDEFHEFSTIPSMIIPLKVFLEMRRLTNKKTILLSGTPDRGLLDIVLPSKWEEKSDIKFFSRESILPTDVGLNKKILLSYTKDELGELKQDTLVTFNSTLAAQKLKILSKEESILCHSKFTSSDLEEVLNKIKEDHSKGKTGGTPVVSPKMLSSSYDLSFKIVENFICTPAIDTQTLGRCNRHQSKEGALFNFIDDGRNSQYITKCLGQKETHIRWKNFLTGKLKEPQSLTHREFAVNFYEEFFSNPENLKVYKKEVFEMAKKSYLDNIYDKWFPMKGRSAPAGVKTGEAKVKTASQVGFRGTSSFISMKIIDPLTLKAVGQIDKINCLTASELYLFDSFKKLTVIWNDRTKTFDKRKKNFGYNTECPFVVSWYEPGEEEKESTNDCDKRMLEGNCDDAYLVYVPGVGVINYKKYKEIYEIGSISTRAAA